jgi:hypothetical protein
MHFFIHELSIMYLYRQNKSVFKTRKRCEKKSGWLRKFRRNILPPSSLISEGEGCMYFETLTIIYKNKGYYNPGDQKMNHLRRENLESDISCLFRIKKQSDIIGKICLFI